MWRSIADSAGPCDAGGGPMTEGNLSGPRRASQSTALLSTHWSDAMHGSSAQDGGRPPSSCMNFFLQVNNSITISCRLACPHLY